MISESTNKEYVKKLNIILNGIEGKSHIEERYSPRFQAIILFGNPHLFPFAIEQYREMAELL